MKALPVFLFLMLCAQVIRAENTVKPIDIVQDPQEVVIQPQPLQTEALPAGSDGGTPAAGRDPFERPVARQIFAGDYGKIADMCRLHGILRQNGKEYGLFSVGADEKTTSAKAGSKQQLRRVASGDELRIHTEKGEYLFKVKSFQVRSAVLIGENGINYSVYL